MNKPIIYFKVQFPNGGIEETVVAQCSEESKYVNFDPNIRWQLKKLYNKNYKDRFRKVYSKQCIGSVFCSNTDYELFTLDRKPASTNELIEKQKCDACNKAMNSKSCFAIVRFEFINKNSCRMIHKGKHTHGIYKKKQ